MKRVLFFLYVMILALFIPMNCFGAEISYDAVKGVAEVRNGDMTFSLIHPDTVINYSYLNKDLEQKLKAQYDIVLFKLDLGGLSSSTSQYHVSLYELKNDLTLYVDGVDYRCIDLYDYLYYLMGWAHFSSSSFRYTADGDLDLYGFLLFPKVLHEATKSVVLMQGTTVLARWDYAKFNALVSVLK